MQNYYEEVVHGESLLRFMPGPRHEVVCQRLQTIVAGCLTSTSRLLPPREVVQLTPGSLVRPDLVVIAVATGKPWLIVEVIDSDDHRADTVIKKTLYEELKLPRLWMVDPRYNNVEVYHGSPYGLALKHILAGREQLTETLLPALSLSMTDLFKPD